MQENSNQNLMQEAMRLAGTPAGQQLLALLQKNGGAELKAAMDQAAAGDYEQAKKALSSLLADPEAKKLLDRLGR
ncbi:MAG: hypothetical protein IJ375_04495 [Oscillospiraceae bacterium]|nr:hypothetical protein [Oscillospiraceae bacterium]